MLVVLPFRDDATSAELLAYEGASTSGWIMALTRPETTELVFISKNEVGDNIGDHSLSDDALVIDFFESRLKAAGYPATSISSAPTVLATWDLTSPEGSLWPSG